MNFIGDTTMSKGTIYKRKDGRREVRISMGKDENGKRVFSSFYGKSREEAEYKAMIAQGQAEEEYVVTEMMVRELVTEGLSARYLTDIIVLFKSIYRYAVREYRIRNVLDGTILPK